jgi:uncharacterized Tic20 family protein
MTRYPPERPPDWLPSSAEGTARPAPGEALPRRPVPPEPWPDYPSMPGYPPMSDYPSMPGYPPAEDYLPAQDYPAAQDYPPAQDYPASPGYPPTPDYQADTDYEPVSGQVLHDEYGTAHEDYGPPPGGYGPAHGGYPLAPGEYRLAHETATAALRAIRPPPEPVAPDARPGPGPVPRYGGTGARMAMLGYLTVPLLGFLVPLAVYLLNLRGSAWTRTHAAQALNVWITVLLYDVSALIMGTMLALDSPAIALGVFGPPVIGVWLAALRRLVQAATAASEGRRYTFPRWLCSRIVR